MFNFIKCLLGIYGSIINGSKEKNQYSDYIRFPDKLNTEPLVSSTSLENILLTWYWVANILLKTQALTFTSETGL